MLQPAEIRANKDLFIERLQKRGLEDISEMLDNILHLDDDRKSTQQSLDSTLAESNAAAKQIGMLMKQGKKEEAEEAKKKASELRQSNHRKTRKA